MENRLQKIRAMLAEKNLDGILVSSVPNIIFLTDYAGFSDKERDGYVFITKKDSYILTHALYKNAVREIANFTLQELSAATPLRAFLEAQKKSGIKTIGFEEDNLSFREHGVFKTFFRLIPAAIAPLREIKSKAEIKHIEAACAITDSAFSFICNELSVGITEKELASKLEIFIMREHATVSFRTIVAFGKNSATPHHLTGETKLKKNCIVLLDFGVLYNNYCSDMTRTIFFGTPTKQFVGMYQAVLEAQQKAFTSLSKSTSAEYIDKVARTHIQVLGYPSIPHGLGHGVGLEVHELPHLSPKSGHQLKEGMVFSLEPGIYEPDFGGIRIEDLAVLEKDGPRFLTHSPREIIAVQ